MTTETKTTTKPAFDAQEQYARNSQLLTQRLVEAQTRNLKYTQSIFESTIALLKSHMEDTRSMLEQWGQQGDSKVAASYMDFFSAPITAYEQMLEGVETVSKQSLESFQKATESFEHGNHAKMDAARK
jgi:hypothetical protein